MFTCIVCVCVCIGRHSGVGKALAVEICAKQAGFHFIKFDLEDATSANLDFTNILHQRYAGQRQGFFFLLFFLFGVAAGRVCLLCLCFSCII